MKYSSAIGCNKCGEYTIIIDANTLKVSNFRPTPTGETLSFNVVCASCGWQAEFKFSKLVITSKPTFNTDLLVPVQSSVIEKIGYDTDTGHLAICFHSSRELYLYDVHSTRVFVEFLNAPSKGKYYSTDIKGSYSRV